MIGAPREIVAVEPVEVDVPEIVPAEVELGLNRTVSSGVRRANRIVPLPSCCTKGAAGELLRGLTVEYAQIRSVWFVVCEIEGTVNVMEVVVELENDLEVERDAERGGPLVTALSARRIIAE